MRILNLVRTACAAILSGGRFAAALERNHRAANALDAAVKEMLQQ